MLLRVVASSPSLVRSTNRDHSCLSVLDIVGSCSELVRSELICLELASILWINSLLIRMAADSKESPASFSASHQAFIWSLLGFVPGKVSFMFTWKALGTTFLSLRATSLVRLFVSNCFVVWVLSRAWHLPWIVLPTSGGVGWLPLVVVTVLSFWGIGFSVCRVSWVKPPLELLGWVGILLAAGFYWGGGKSILVLLERAYCFGRCGTRNSC